jgi:hypothetical protein
MENNQRVNEAIERVFAKLFAMTHEELDARLAKREIGPSGRVFLDRAINDELPDDKLASLGGGAMPLS